MVDDNYDVEYVFRSKRHRLKSLPITSEYGHNQPFLDFVRRHRNSDVTIKEWSMEEGGHTSMREVSSEPHTISLLLDSVGVKSYNEWQPRSHGCLLQEHNAGALLADHHKFVLSPAEFTDSCLSYKPNINIINNPLKSELLLRVLFMLASSSNNNDNGDGEPLPSIQDQFLSEEQIRENLLKELLDGVSRLNQDQSHIEGTKNETVTPVEFICNKIPNMIRRNSHSNIKSEPLSHVSSVCSMDSHSSDTSHDPEVTPTSSQQSLQYHHKKKSSTKLSAREKNLFAPVSF